MPTEAETSDCGPGTSQAHRLDASARDTNYPLVGTWESAMTALRAEVRRIADTKSSDVHLGLYHASDIYSMFTALSESNQRECELIRQQMLEKASCSTEVRLLRSDLETSSNRITDFGTAHEEMLAGIRALGQALDQPSKGQRVKGWRGTLHRLRSAARNEGQPPDSSKGLDEILTAIEVAAGRLEACHQIESDRSLVIRDPNVYMTRLIRESLNRAQSELKRVAFRR